MQVSSEEGFRLAMATSLTVMPQICIPTPAVIAFRSKLDRSGPEARAETYASGGGKSKSEESARGLHTPTRLVARKETTRGQRQTGKLSPGDPVDPLCLQRACACRHGPSRTSRAEVMSTNGHAHSRPSVSARDAPELPTDCLRVQFARKDEMPPRMRGHPLSPPEDPSSNPNSATQPHAELYERTADAQDPLFPNSPPLDSQGAEMQRTISQLARVEADSEAAASPHGNDSLASQRSLQIATTSAQRTSTPSSVRSRAASPLASPTAPSAYAAFADPFSSIVPARLSFPSAPHRLSDETISSIPLSHLVALVKALSRDLDATQASLRSQRAELAALEKLVRDKGASEGEVERVKVRARTGVEEEVGDSAGGGKRVAGSGGRLAAEDWSIDLPPAEEEALPPPKTEVSIYSLIECGPELKLNVLNNRWISTSTI